MGGGGGIDFNPVAAVGRAVNTIKDTAIDASKGDINLGKIAGKAINTSADLGSGGAVKSVGSALFGKSPDRPDQPDADPNINALANRQMDYANKLRADMPGQEAKMTHAMQRGEQQNLNKELGGIKSESANRGLLYSGINQSKQAQANIASQAKRVGSEVDIHNQLEDKTRQAENLAMESALRSKQTSQDIQNIALQNANKRQGGLIGGFTEGLFG